MNGMNGNRLRLPSADVVRQLVELVRDIVFPGYFSEARVDDSLDMLSARLEGLLPGLVGERTSEVAASFIAELPEIRRLLETDVDALMHNDPAVEDRAEVIFCYPSITVMLHYRTAHALLGLGVPVLPRIITERAHSLTGIDIHPAATIGEYFGIDHGTGVVIGATAIIGAHVMLYQGVTLGAKNFTYSEDGRPIDIPRHPILEDNVTVYSNASILGRIRIGHDTVIGGNVWLTEDVAPCSRVLQSSVVRRPIFKDGAGI